MVIETFGAVKALDSLPMNPNHIHQYSAQLVWDGNLGSGTADYSGYSRAHRIEIAGKPDLLGSSDAAFRGDAKRHTPEDLFIAALSACHMLSYLALCARSGVCVVSYEDDASGVLLCDQNGGGRFSEVTLCPRVTITDAARESLAQHLHKTAHERCYIASSCNVPIRVKAEILIHEPGFAPNADAKAPS